MMMSTSDPFWINHLKELSTSLASISIKKEDICIVGSAVLACYNLRKNKDIDIIIKEETRKENTFPDHAFKISENVEVVAKDWCFFDKNLTDDQLIDENRNHFIYEGFKFVNLDILKNRKKASKRNKDREDMEMIFQEEAPQTPLNALIENIAFGPDGSMEKVVFDFISSAKKKIDIMVFWMTWVPIAEAILQAYRRGIEIRILMDKRTTEEKRIDKDPENERIIPKMLKDNGFKGKNLKVYDGELMHHKTILVDGDRTLTGTCNFFSGSLLRHEEVLFIIKSKKVNQKFEERFVFLWENRAEEYNEKKHK